MRSRRLAGAKCSGLCSWTLLAVAPPVFELVAQNCYASGGTWCSGGESAVGLGNT